METTTASACKYSPRRQRGMITSRRVHLQATTQQRVTGPSLEGEMQPF